MNQIPFTLLTESEKNLEAENCLYIKLAGVGRWVEEGREELGSGGGNTNAVCAGFDLLNYKLKVRIFKSHWLQFLHRPCQGNR